MARAPEDTLVGKTLGSYELISCIGAGGIGRVYLARHAGDRTRWFAVKVLHDATAHEWNAGTLAEQVRVGHSLLHPNVAPVIDAGFAGHHRYVVSEYVASATVDRMNRIAPPSAGCAAAILCDTLAGLEAIHRATDVAGNRLGLIHRDVSPDNILVGLDGRARIADFDIAKATTQPKRTRPGLVKGKFSFMSPEQISGERIDHRSDVFSAGVVLFNALTRTKLFDATSLEMHLVELFEQPTPRPSQVGAMPSSRYDEVVLRALERDPERRFQSAGQMRDALIWAAGEDLAPASAVAERVLATTGRALNGVLLQHLHGVRSLERSAPRAKPPKPRRIRRWRIAAVAVAMLVGGAAGVVAGSRAAQRSTPAPVALATTAPALVSADEPVSPPLPEFASVLDVRPSAVASTSGFTKALVPTKAVVVPEKRPKKMCKRRRRNVN